MFAIFETVTNLLKHDEEYLKKWWNHVLSWVPRIFRRTAEINRKSILDSGRRLLLHLALVFSKQKMTEFVKRMNSFQDQIDVNDLPGLKNAPHASHAKRAHPSGYPKRKKPKKCAASNTRNV